jgi:TetR/AcrR family transcriptional regulator, tetracycline repressor protein
MRSRSPGRPAVLSREAVLTCALRIADEQGIERLTMRRLGAELGADPMAVYHYVPDKSALFDGIVELVYAEVPLPAPSGRRRADLRAVANAFRDTLRGHAGALPLLATRPPVTLPAFALVEAACGLLREAGFGEQDAADAVDCVGRLVIGHVLAEAGSPPGPDVTGCEIEHEQAQLALPPDRFPNLAAIAGAGVRHDPDRLFRLALDGLILALDARLGDA